MIYNPTLMIITAHIIAATIKRKRPQPDIVPDVLFKGCPHLGQEEACFETSAQHSGQLTSVPLFPVRTLGVTTDLAIDIVWLQ